MRIHAFLPSARILAILSLLVAGFAKEIRTHLSFGTQGVGRISVLADNRASIFHVFVRKYLTTHVPTALGHSETPRSLRSGGSGAANSRTCRDPRALGDALFQGVQEPARGAASLMLGGQKARGYCLEMVCADFLAGASLHDCGNAESLLLALSRTYQLLPTSQRQEFLLRIPKAS